jgi:DNA replication protein DnaC
VTFNPNTPVSFDQRFQMIRNAPFLVLDDLTTEGSVWAKEKLFQIIDYRYVTRRPTVFTTYKHIDEIDTRIRSRLLDERICTMFALKGPDYPSRFKRRKS